MASAERPLSPHLQVYRPQWTSILSISHRATGVALVAGAVVLVWWLAAAAGSPEYYESFQGIAGSILGHMAGNQAIRPLADQGRRRLALHFGQQRCRVVLAKMVRHIHGARAPSVIGLQSSECLHKRTTRS